MSPSNEARRAQPLLGTIVEIYANGMNANAAIDAAFAKVKQIQGLMSFHEPDSDVTRINKTGISIPIAISTQTYQVLAFADELSHRSTGLFDITIGGPLVAAGFLPRSERVDYNCRSIDFKNLELLPDSHVRLTKPVCIDLGGIAKGYAVDAAIACLQAHGMETGLVNAGGDLRFFGKAQFVHVQNPCAPTQMFKLGPLSDSAVASSSGYYTTKSYNNKTVDPLVDARFGECKLWGEGVTVVAPSCMVADALTKVVRLSPASAVDAIVDHFDAQAFTVNANGIHQAHTP
jgi:thiamine biosynthesis lipoprotein